MLDSRVWYRCFMFDDCCCMSTYINYCRNVEEKQALLALVDQTHFTGSKQQMWFDLNAEDRKFNISKALAPLFHVFLSQRRRHFPHRATESWRVQTSAKKRCCRCQYSPRANAVKTEKCCQELHCTHIVHTEIHTVFLLHVGYCETLNAGNSGGSLGNIPAIMLERIEGINCGCVFAVCFNLGFLLLYQVLRCETTWSSLQPAHEPIFILWSLIVQDTQHISVSGTSMRSLWLIELRYCNIIRTRTCLLICNWANMESRFDVWDISHPLNISHFTWNLMDFFVATFWLFAHVSRSFRVIRPLCRSLHLTRSLVIRSLAIGLWYGLLW